MSDNEQASEIKLLKEEIEDIKFEYQVLSVKYKNLEAMHNELIIKQERVLNELLSLYDTYPELTEE